MWRLECPLCYQMCNKNVSFYLQCAGENRRSFLKLIIFRAKPKKGITSHRCVLWKVCGHGNKKQNCFKVQVNSTEPGFPQWKRVEHPSLVVEQSVSGAG